MTKASYSAGAYSVCLFEVILHENGADVAMKKALSMLCAHVRGQPVMLGIHRSDYMMHDVGKETENILQVEFNTISSSFGCLSSRVSQLHR